jgi:dihydroxy-acid dehydratase
VSGLRILSFYSFVLFRVSNIRTVLIFFSLPSFSRSHGFCIGHVVPEAQVGGPIALVRDGDIISVDAVENTIELRVSPEELEERRKLWKAPPPKATQGTLYKYMKNVTDASHGCITDA